MLFYTGIVLYGLALLLTILLYVDFMWQRRVFVASAIAGLIGLATTLVFAADFSLYGLLLVATAGYVVVNAARVVKERLNPERIQIATKKSFGTLWVLLGAALVLIYIQPEGSGFLVAYLIVSLVVASVLLVTTVDRLFATKTAKPKPMSDEQLPTLSIAIAARNETATLHSCLEAVIASDYPKLEILVLDDCSQDKTAEVIRQFARNGVRFVQGEPPTDALWLPKNKAYQQLLDASSGKYILFMGVDVRLKPDTVRLLVEHVMVKNLKMVSVLPKRTKSGFVASLIQPMRYWWEIAVPRSKARPSVLSTLWIADREALVSAGGFAATARSIVPEWYISRTFAQSNSYAFLRHDRFMQVTTHKDFTSQWLTAVRTRYPQVRRRPENVLLQGTFMTLLLAGPFVVFVFLVTGDLDFPYVVLGALPVLLLTTSHMLIAFFTNPAAAWLAPVNFPFAVVLDLIALHISMWRYEFGDVQWKGRNVCEPVMHVYPSLPPLDASRDSERKH